MSSSRPTLAPTEDYVRDYIIKFKLWRGKTMPDELLDHVLQVLSRHTRACLAFGVEPLVDRSIIEAVEDYYLTQKFGPETSVLAELPEDVEERFMRYWPRTKLSQYVSPTHDN